MGSAPGNDFSAPTGGVRNVVLVGHSGAGKTTLAESLLVSAGAIPRAGAVPAGTTASDYDDAEIRQQRSINVSVVPLHWEDIKVNILDAPGTPTSSVTCAPGCAARTRRCSSCPPSRASTGPLECCGTSARRSTCHAPS